MSLLSTLWRSVILIEFIDKLQSKRLALRNGVSCCLYSSYWFISFDNTQNPWFVCNMKRILQYSCLVQQYWWSKWIEIYSKRNRNRSGTFSFILLAHILEHGYSWKFVKETKRKPIITTITRHKHTKQFRFRTWEI